MPDQCFCERVRDDTNIRQFSNAWSNYAFVLVGLYVRVASPEQIVLLVKILKEGREEYNYLFTFLCVKGIEQRGDVTSCR